MKIRNYQITRTVLLDIIVLVTILLMLITPLLMHHQKSPDVLYPAPLRPGDKIAVLSPAGPIKQTVVDSAVTVMRDLGYQVEVYPHTFGKNGHFSGTTDERYADLEAALTDPSVRAIVCSRGGYGVVHNLDRLGRLDLRRDPKWIVGFSDISALHALMASQGVASVHASMASHIGWGIDDPDNKALFDILAGKMPSYTFEGSPYNHPGRAEGKLLGGNLAVIADLMATPFDIIKPGTILFIEDVSEPIYKIERILIQLRLAGILPHLKGLIIGRFTDYRPDDNHQTMEAMIAEIVAPYSYPVAFGAPVGHVDHNVPLVESSWATLDVTRERSVLTLAR